MKKITLIAITLITSLSSANAASRMGRLGIGMADNLPTDMKTLSVKLQRNRSTALGGSFALDSSSDGTQYAIGLKIYKNIYEEPQLNFYSTLGFNLFTYQETEDDKTSQGYNLEAAFGAEYSFQGLESIGFSFEFGVGLNQYNSESRFQTFGHQSLSSAVHFYL